MKIGCCGFPVARDKYFKDFAVVELQSTFYHPPSDAFVQKWRAEAPPGFEYTLKAWQLITHDPKSPTYGKLKMKIPASIEQNFGSFKPTDEVFAAWERTRAVAEMVKARVIVFQSPPSFVPSSGNKRNLETFFSRIKRKGFTLAWEPRGDWETSDISPICNDLHLVHVVDPFKATTAGAGDGLRYYRLHGLGGYKYNYTERNLLTLRKLCQKHPSAYLMFNNTHMYENALAIKKLLGEEVSEGG